MIGINGVIDFEKSDNNRVKLHQEEIIKMNNPELTYESACNDNSIIHLFNNDNKILSKKISNTEIYILGKIYNENEDKIIPNIYNLFENQKDRELCGFNGSYCIVIFDQKEKSLSIYLDDNSVIPIYYKQVSSSLFISWNIFHLSQVKKTDSKINYENLFSWILIGGRGFNDETRYTDIKRLEPGSNLKFQDKKIIIKKNDPFKFIPSSLNEDQLLENCHSSIIKACDIRLKNQNNFALGLSGGIDSRLVFAALRKNYRKNIYAYTYGPKGFVESDIAKQICSHYGYKHSHIFLNRKLFIDHAKDGLFYAGGASLFKHGIQPHLFSSIKNKSGAKALMLGSALDLVLGSTFSNDKIYQFKNKSELLQYYKDNIFNYSLEGFREIFNNSKDATHHYDYCYELIKSQINNTEGDTIADINDALSFEVRIKRWYNYNLVYPLYSLDLLLPTYDKNFLYDVSKVPAHYRKDSSFRIKLMNKIDIKVAEYIYDSTMQPAKILPPQSIKYKKIVTENEKKLHLEWFQSNREDYIPSNKYDANFLEWIRVYPEYQIFAKELLMGESKAKNKYLKSQKIGNLIDQHISGLKDLHKQLVMLISSQIFLNLHSERNQNIKYNFKNL